MSEDMYWKLRQLAQMLLDARLAAGAVRQQAGEEKIANAADYDFIADVAALRERLAQLMEKAERLERGS